MLLNKKDKDVKPWCYRLLLTSHQHAWWWFEQKGVPWVALLCTAWLSQEPSASAGPYPQFSNYKVGAITQLCAKASSIRVTELYVMRLFRTWIYSQEYTDEFFILSLRMLNQITASWASGEHIYHRNHTHHTWVQYIWVKGKLLEVLRLGFFSWGRKTVLRGAFLSYSTCPLKPAPPISCQGYGDLHHQESPEPHPWPTLYFYIIHLLKNSNNPHTWKREKKITVNTSTADVVYTNSTVKL